MAKYRSQLITYFNSTDNIDPQRKYEEVPYQMDRLGDTTQLFSFIVDTKHFQKLAGDDFKFDLYYYWRRIPANLNPENQFVSILQNVKITNSTAAEVAKLIETAASFFKEMGSYRSSETLYEFV